MTDLVSIIVPIFNSEKYIEAIIKQILKQTYENIELILVNDGSTDNSESIVKSFLNDSRIKYISQTNGGPSKARNTGLKHVNGQYITFIDSDDSIAPDYIEKLYNGIIEFDSDICCCGYEYIGFNEAYKHHDFLPFGQINKDNFVKNIFSGTGGITWGKIYKSNILLENNIQFDENFKLCEDQLFALTAWSKSTKFCSIDYNGYIYNGKNESSLMHNNNFHKWCQQFDLIKKEESILNKYVNSSIAKECLDKKIKNVLFSLVYSGLNNNEKELRILLKSNQVKYYTKKISINDFKSFVYYFPFKTKCFFIIKTIYNVINKLKK